MRGYDQVQEPQTRLWPDDCAKVSFICPTLGDADGPADRSMPGQGYPQEGARRALLSIGGKPSLWSATRRATLLEDNCDEYAELARIQTTEEDRTYYQFITFNWSALDTSKLPPHYAALVRAAGGFVRG